MCGVQHTTSFEKTAIFRRGPAVMATAPAEAERSSHEAETSSSSDGRASQSTGLSEGDLIQSNNGEKGTSKKEDRKGGMPTVELTNEPSENEGVMDQSSVVAKVRKRSSHAEQSSALLPVER